YVALTRARERLVLCGRIAANRKEETLKGWWAQIRAGFEDAAIAPHVRQAACGEVLAIRYGPDPIRKPGPVDPIAAPLTAPGWAAREAPPELLARYASPSRL